MVRKISPITDTSKLPTTALLGRMMAMGVSQSMESLELSGQRELLEARGTALPIKGSDHPGFQALGFQFGEAYDSMFREAKLPPDWRLLASDNPMHTFMVDRVGQKRGHVFYRAGRHDRAANIGLKCRYTVDTAYEGEFGQVGESARCFIFDNAKLLEVFSTKTLRRASAGDRTFVKTEVLFAEAQAEALKRFPEYKDPTAYWEKL